LIRFARRACVPVLVAVLAAIAGPGGANEKLKGIACRSVHLQYPAAEGTAFHTELTVTKSAPGTYFMACGWDKGYFGIQEKGDGKKVALFSVWDSGQNDPNAVAAGERVKVVYKDEKVRAGRFGGEGSGGQSFLDLDWKAGETYGFVVTAAPDGNRTEYTGFLRGPGASGWRRLVTFSTVTGGKRLRGYYSFVEDFKRDRVSTTKERRAEYGNGWVRSVAGAWVPLDGARFTADANPVTNIDAGAVGGRYYLATGGDTNNTGTKLRGEVRLPSKPAATPPAGLPEPPAASGSR
jgi:hypothetical protein